MFKEIVDGRTDGRMDDGRRTLKDHKSSLSTSCSGELKREMPYNLRFVNVWAATLRTHHQLFLEVWAPGRQQSHV